MSVNSAVVWLIRNHGSTKSRQLLNQALDLFRLVDDNDTLIAPRHILGCKNILADALSRPDITVWMLHPQVLLSICLEASRPIIGLLATRLNHQLPTYVFPVPVLAAWAVDVCPCRGKSGRVHLSTAHSSSSLGGQDSSDENFRLLLVAPFWPARTWFSELVSFCGSPPQTLSTRPDLIRHPYSHLLYPDAE